MATSTKTNAAAVLDPHDPWDADIIASFKNGRYRPKTLTGPLILYRLLGLGRGVPGQKQKRSDLLGVYWFEQALYDELLRDMRDAALNGDRGRINEPAHDIRVGLAVKDEWNSIDSIAKLTIPAGQTLLAFVGPTEFQFDSIETRRVRQAYAGGYTQYIIKYLSPYEKWVTKQPMTSLWREVARGLPRIDWN